MNYRELAEELNRPVSTIRKWRSDIAKISGKDFALIKVRNGRGRKNRTTYDFTTKEVEKFKVFKKLLSEGKNKEQAILEVFGNKRLEEKEQLIEIVNVQNNLIKNLTKKQKELIKQVYFLQREIEAFNTRLETLENKGFKRIFKK